MQFKVGDKVAKVALYLQAVHWGKKKKIGVCENKLAREASREVIWGGDMVAPFKPPPSSP